jgi:hypothetical protein
MALTDYSDLEQEIKDAPEPKVLPAGTEVNFRIISVRSGISDKNDCRWYQPVFDVPDDPMVIEFNDFFWELDREKLDQKQYARALHDFKVFAECIDLDYSRPFSWEDDLPSKTGWAILGIKKDTTYGEGNTVKSYIVRR